MDIFRETQAEALRKNDRMILVWQVGDGEGTPYNYYAIETRLPDWNRLWLVFDWTTHRIPVDGEDGWTAVPIDALPDDLRRAWKQDIEHSLELAKGVK